MKVIPVCNATLVTVNPLRAERPRTVFIRSGVIAAPRPGPDAPGALGIDAAGCIFTPGLVTTHHPHKGNPTCPTTRMHDKAAAFGHAKRRCGQKARSAQTEVASITPMS